MCTGANATYISWKIQNEIISSFNSILLKKLVDKVNASKYFSVLCDETTDISGTTQMSLCSLDIKQILSSTQQLLEFYELDESGGMGEVTLWVQFIKDKTEKPQSAIEALEKCNKNLFPTIYELFNIMTTLPVTTCSCERSFSSLKFLKNYLRNSTGDDRLNGLALMYIHPDIPILEDEVLDVLALQSRRIKILL
ncbi:hypothetical protein NQ315_002806 [Exocentrus adspersus]|uniref:HAT C-terminal dimerisation domain-containing protein n=1 Tax=Exocentrus adspersus TaxID=1586481 RepID=A0AAV8VJY4_9CUCU|nr:hypothetical protein NQ315_002806 [Exocentrus adspersus]